jgi:predicted TIM-barrel fold metal-dependent hydrolase
MDFKNFPKIDAHIHFNTDRHHLPELGREWGFSFITINTEVPEFPSIPEQKKLAVKHRKKSDGRLQFITTVPSDNIFEPGWADYAIDKISRDLKDGACAVKFWKNIGMSIQRTDGSFLMPDDPELEPVFRFLEREGIPVIGHQGEPKNCWLPIEEMTVKSDREYFTANPRYHMYQKSQFPDYWDHINARDRILERHPGLRFVGAHLASLEWNIDEVADRLDRFPNLAVDMAERISHLEYQTRDDRSKVLDFFDTYQDRIIYGTDIIDDPEAGPEEVRKELLSRWNRHWRLFGSDDTLTSSQISGEFRGLDLSDSILEKVYRENARNWYLELSI